MNELKQNEIFELGIPAKNLRNQEFKVCCRCKIKKLKGEFHKRKANADGLNGHCRECGSLEAKRHLQKRLYKGKHGTPEERAIFQRELKKSRKSARAFYWKNRGTNHEQIMFVKVKSRAKKENLPFNLEVEDIIIPEYCPYLNIKIKISNRDGSLCSSPSIDRIHPDRGYVKGNIMIISHKANSMKSNATFEELETFSKNGLKIINKILQTSQKNIITPYQ